MSIREEYWCIAKIRKDNLSPITALRVLNLMQGQNGALAANVRELTFNEIIKEIRSGKHYVNVAVVNNNISNSVEFKKYTIEFITPEGEIISRDANKAAVLLQIAKTDTSDVIVTVPSGKLARASLDMIKKQGREVFIADYSYQTVSSLCNSSDKGQTPSAQTQSPVEETKKPEQTEQTQPVQIQTAPASKRKIFDTSMLAHQLATSALTPQEEAKEPKEEAKETKEVTVTETRKAPTQEQLNRRGLGEAPSGEHRNLFIVENVHGIPTITGCTDLITDSEILNGIAFPYYCKLDGKEVEVRTIYATAFNGIRYNMDMSDTRLTADLLNALEAIPLDAAAREGYCVVYWSDYQSNEEQAIAALNMTRADKSKMNVSLDLNNVELHQRNSITFIPHYFDRTLVRGFGLCGRHTNWGTDSQSSFTPRFFVIAHKEIEEVFSIHSVETSLSGSSSRAYGGSGYRFVLGLRNTVIKMIPENFASETTVRHITFPDTLLEIHSAAFKEVYKHILMINKFPSSLFKIGTDAFKNTAIQVSEGQRIDLNKTNVVQLQSNAFALSGKVSRDLRTLEKKRGERYITPMKLNTATELVSTSALAGMRLIGDKDMLGDENLTLPNVKKVNATAFAGYRADEQPKFINLPNVESASIGVLCGALNIVVGNDNCDFTIAKNVNTKTAAGKLIINSTSKSIETLQNYFKGIGEPYHLEIWGQNLSSKAINRFESVEQICAITGETLAQVFERLAQEKADNLDIEALIERRRHYR